MKKALFLVLSVLLSLGSAYSYFTDYSSTNISVSSGVSVNLSADTGVNVSTLKQEGYIKLQDNIGWYSKGSNCSVSFTPRVGYNFEVFEVNGKPVLDNPYTFAVNSYTEVRAVTSPINYGVHFICDNAESGMMDSIMVSYESQTKLPTFSYKVPYFHFIGWKAVRSSDGFTAYIPSKGTCSDVEWYLEGSQPDGYSTYLFQDGDDFSTASTVDGDNINMYAQMEKNVGYMHYYPNGGVIRTDRTQHHIIETGEYAGSSSFVYPFDYTSTSGNTVSDVEWLYQKEGYYSDWYNQSWHVGSPNSNIYIASEEEDMSKYCRDAHDVHLRLYANWLPIEYLVSFDSNGGTGLNSLSCTYDKSFTLPTSSRQGYTLVGWYDSVSGKTYEAGSSVVNLTSVNHEIVTLKAVWKPAGSSGGS